MNPLAQGSHSRHKTKFMKSPSSEDTGVQKKTSVELKENLPVADAILQDLSILINDEWLAVAKFLKIPEESLQKIHTDYGARQKEATYRMFLGWKEEMGKNATYGALTEALKKAGRGDLADLSTELIDPQECLLVLKETLERQQRLLDLHKREMTKNTLLSFSEWHDLQERQLLHMKEMFRCQEELFDLHKREMTKNTLLSFSEWHDLGEELSFNMEETFSYQENMIDLQKREMERKSFLSSSKSHDLQECLLFMEETLNCQERFIDLQNLELAMEKQPIFYLESFDLRQRLSVTEDKSHRRRRLFDLEEHLTVMKCKSHRLRRLCEQQKFELAMGKKPFLPSESLDIDESDEKEALKKGTLNVQGNVKDKLSHFIRCLKAKYTTFVKSLKSTPWMKSENLNIEDLFVDVGLLLWNPSQSTMSGSGWQSLDSFQALFTHPQLRRAQSINVEGESGSGKTVLLHRMAYSWCINESFTKDVKLFILLPSRCIHENYFDCSLYMTIKRFLLPVNTVLTESDVRDILTNTKSVLAVDDSSLDNVNRTFFSLNRYEVPRSGFEDLWDLQLGKKLQLICFTSDYTNTPYTDNISEMTVKIQKWQKKHQLLYLQKLLPNDEKTQDLILKRLCENSILVNECGNSLFYVLFVHLLKDHLVCGKEVTIENLSQLFKSTFESLTKNTGMKQVENEKESETIFSPQGISKAAYECFRKNECHIDLPAKERGYQMLVDVGILVLGQCDWFYTHSNHYMMPATVVTHRVLRFCHKIFQVWYAALYLSECSNVRKKYDGLFFPKHLSYWSTPPPSRDNALLQRFICGLNSECSVILLEGLAEGWYTVNDDNDENFFLCLNEHCGDDDSLRDVVNTICERKREFKLECSNELVLKSMARIFNLASRWKITIDCIDIMNHDIVDVDEEGLTLNNDVCLRPLSAKLIRINKWCGKQLPNYLNKCVHLVETRIFANDPRERRHEIQREVKEMNFKVRWESNYEYESNVRETKEDEIINLAALFENLDVDSGSTEDATTAKTSENIEEMWFRNDVEDNDSTNSFPESLKFNFEQIQDSPSAVLNAILSTQMYLDAKGGTLVIEEAGISLEIPPGALNEGVTISVAVVNDEGVILPHDDTPMVSQIVRCKPSGQTFQKPVTLVLPHCGILNDNKDHKVISLKSHFSGGLRQWSIFTDTETVLSKRECSLKLTNFCFHSCSISGLESKIMRAFILKKRTEGALSVKLWICNDNPSVFAVSRNILNVERDDGYQQMGAHQEFAIYKRLGDIKSKCIGDEMKIPLADIWRGRGRFVVFHISFDSGNIGETLVAKQLGQEDDCSLRFFIDEKVHCKRRKLKQKSTDSTIPEQPSALISVPRNPLSSSKTVSTAEERNEVKDVNGNDLVSESSLRKLSGLLTSEWKDLGIELGLTEADMQHIRNDHQGKEKEIIYQMLLCWKKAKGQEATYGHIFEKLKRVGRLDLVEIPKLKEKWVNT